MDRPRHAGRQQAERGAAAPRSGRAPTPTGTMASAKAKGSAAVSAARPWAPSPRSRASTSAASAGRVRTALEKTWPSASARIGTAEPLVRGTFLSLKAGGPEVRLPAGSVAEHLARVEDALGVEARLDAAHHRQRLGAVLRLQELALAEADAVLARSRCRRAPGRAPRSSCRSPRRFSWPCGSFGSKRMTWWKLPSPTWPTMQVVMPEATASSLAPTMRLGQAGDRARRHRW